MEVSFTEDEETTNGRKRSMQSMQLDAVKCRSALMMPPESSQFAPERSYIGSISCPAQRESLQAFQLQPPLQKNHSTAPISRPCTGISGVTICFGIWTGNREHL